VPVFEERLVCVASASHAGARRRGMQLQELAGEPFVLYGRGSTTRAILDAAFAAAGFAPQVAMETASPEAMKRLAEVGVGITVMPEALVGDEVAAGRLVRLAVDDVRFERRLGTAILRGRTLSAAARRFLEFVQRRFPPLAER
jgi:DNA-binding transcriptional LysR family regulator